MTRRPGALALPALLAVAGLLLTGCGGGSGGSGSSGQVASLAGASSAAKPSPTSSADVEKELLSYVECLRGQGLNIPDPTVDADGKLTLGRPAGGTGTGAAGSFDRDKFTAAQKVCGPIPAGITAGLSNGDQSALQDAALKFTKCMRGEGVDVADPDFSQSGGAAGGLGSIFQGLDRNDPKVAAAIKVCQKDFAGVSVGGGN